MRTNQKSIEFSLFTDLNISDENIGAKILSILYNHGANYAPEMVDYGKNWKKTDKNNFNFLLTHWPRVNNILFRRESKYKAEIAFFLGNLTTTPKFMSCWIEEAFFENTFNIKEFLETSKLFYDLIHPHYALIHSTEEKVEKATIMDPKFGKTVLPINLARGLPGIYWANFFGPNYVEKIGKRKLLLAPCFQVEELSDGGLLFLTGPSPLIRQNAETLKNCEGLIEYIGKELFYP